MQTFKLFIITVFSLVGTLSYANELPSGKSLFWGLPESNIGGFVISGDPAQRMYDGMSEVTPETLETEGETITTKTGGSAGFGCARSKRHNRKRINYFCVLNLADLKKGVIEN